MEITVEEAIKYLESEYECAKCILLNKKGSCSDECVKVKNGELESQEDREKLITSYEMALRILRNGWAYKVEIKDWLSSFNTNSATACFTAVQQLKNRGEKEYD